MDFTPLLAITTGAWNHFEVSNSAGNRILSINCAIVNRLFSLDLCRLFLGLG